MAKRTMMTIIAASVALAAMGIGPSAMGFGLSNLLGHHGNSDSNTQILKQQSRLVNDFTSAQKQILTSQALLVEAFGLKKQAAVLRADRKALKSGASAQDIEKSIGDSSKANQQIQKYQKEGVQLSAKGKKLYKKAVPYYARGLAQTIALRPDIKNFASGARKAIGSSSIVGKLSLKNKLASGMYISEHSPAYIRELQGTSVDIVTYAKKEKIAIPSNTLSSLAPG